MLNSNKPLTLIPKYLASISMAELAVATEAKEEESGDMKPWEQHSGVISLPRYDYKAPSSFLTRSFSGFLVTCPISYFLPLSILFIFLFSYIRNLIIWANKLFVINLLLLYQRGRKVQLKKSSPSLTR